MSGFWLLYFSLMQMNKPYFYTVILIFLVSGVHPVRAQLVKRTIEKDSANYQGLIRRNLELRKEFRALEEKYMSLEDERKVLILHVKDLQGIRDGTNAVVQDLKSKIASLRVEMFKDPKMVKTIDGLNQKVRESLDEKDELTRRVDILGKEKERLFNELNVLRGLYNEEKALYEKKKALQVSAGEEEGEESRKAAKELEDARVAFKKKEEVLIAEVHRIKEAKASLKKKNQDLEDELKEITALLEKSRADLKETASRIQRDKEQDDDKLRMAFAVSERALNAKIKDLEEEKGGFKDRNRMLEKELKEVNRDLTKENSALAEKIEEIKRAQEKRLAAAQSVSAKKEEDFKRDIRLIESEKDGLRKTSEGLKRTLQEAKADLMKTQEILKGKASRKEDSDGKDSQKRLTREIKEIEGRNKILEKEKEGLARKLQELNVSMEQSNDFSEARIEEVRREQEDLLAQVREAFAQKEESLIQRAKSVESQKNILDGKLKEVERSAMAAEKELLAQVEKMKKANATLLDDLENEDARFSQKTSEMSKTAVRLGVDLENARKEKDTVSGELAEIKKRFKEIDGENQWLQKERKDINARLKEVTKQIETQKREAEYDREYLGQKEKNAKADKMMYEAKAEDSQRRAEVAEAKFRATEKELKTREAQTSLQESEIMVLREAKSKLEQKLIRYIEKIIQNEDSGHSRVEAGAGSTLVGQVSLSNAKAKTKKETAQIKLKMHYNLALAYDKQGLYREEEKEYLKCLKISPRDANVHYNLAILYDDKMNLNKKAIYHYKRFLELRPIGEDVQQVKRWMLNAEQEDRLGPAMK